MPRKYNKKHGYWYHEGPYTEEEQREMAAWINQAPVAFTRPGPAPTPPAQEQQGKPEEQSSPRPKP